MTAASDSFSKKSVPLDMEKWRPLVLGWEQSEESQKSRYPVINEPLWNFFNVPNAEASVSSQLKINQLR